METILDKSLILFRYLQDKVLTEGGGGEGEGKGEGREGEGRGGGEGEGSPCDQPSDLSFHAP